MNIVLTLIALFFSGLVAATPLKNIVIFGDSLSDNGNLYEYMQHKLPQSPPYYEGRFTNGPVWVERLAEAYFPGDIKNHLLDYAFGGAGISDDADEQVLFTLKREIDSYLVAHEDKAAADSLFIVWIGANNYLGVPDNVEQTLRDVNAGITHSLARLADAGAKHILVLNLPDLGKTPVARLFDAQETLSYYSVQHNLALAASVSELQETYKDVQWLQYDVNHLLNGIFEHPERYGFNNIVDTCYDVIIDKPSQQSVLKIASHMPLKSKGDVCSAYLFFDPVHPSALAHQLMADNAKQLLDAAGLEFGDEQ